MGQKQFLKRKIWEVLIMKDIKQYLQEAHTKAHYNLKYLKTRHKKKSQGKKKHLGINMAKDVHGY
jgi:hypothetical protein